MSHGFQGVDFEEALDRSIPTKQCSFGDFLNTINKVDRTVAMPPSNVTTRSRTSKSTTQSTPTRRSGIRKHKQKPKPSARSLPDTGVDTSLPNFRESYGPRRSERDTGVDFSLPNFRKEIYDLKRGHGQEREETATMAETLNSGVCQKIPVSGVDTDLASVTRTRRELDVSVTWAWRGRGVGVTRYTHHKTNQEVFKIGTGRVPILSREKLAFGRRVTESANALITVDNQDSVSSRDSTIASESITIDLAFEDDREGWIAAIIKELKALESTGNFTVLSGNPPAGRKLITSRLVLRYKSATNALERIKKARVVARGFQQEAGLDYSETFASVVRYNTLRIILGIAAVRDLEIDSVDIDTAFLNPPLKQETYMELPPFFELLDPAATRRTHFLKLNKSLYGLKQAPHEWFMMVNAFFKKIGLHAGDSDPNMFIGNGVILLLFVDDMLITGSRKSVDETKHIILSHWKGKDLKETKTFVGFEIERDRHNRTIRIHQKSYTIKLLSRLSMLHCNATELPMPAGTVLKDDDESEMLDRDEVTLYQQLIGSAIYLSNNTKPDIAYPVGQLARFMSKPRKLHLKLAKQLLRYLKSTQNLGIQFGGSKQIENQYSAWTDATWGTESDRKSFQGYVIVWYGGATSWAANRQKSTALSTMEAEIMAASEGAKELAWMEKVCSDLNLDWKEPSTLWTDNEAAMELSKTTKFHNKAKHIEIKYLFVRNDMMQRNRISVKHVAGNDQIADVLTKQLTKEKFQKLISGFGLTAVANTKPSPQEET
ncbi:hypothetical protein K3495_g3287 [Podosphaera aphanis]|nr:hypothetical protein K3495_g3287 [Podosphaera aphanis]